MEDIEGSVLQGRTLVRYSRTSAPPGKSGAPHDVCTTVEERRFSAALDVLRRKRALARWNVSAAEPRRGEGDLHRRHRLTKYSKIDSTTLTTTELANGKYTVVFFPRYKKSPGSRPSGKFIRPSNIITIPTTTRTAPKPTSSFPSSITSIP